MGNESPFADAWRDCLREHYKQVVRDSNTQRHDEMTQIMHQAGFTEDELITLYIQATMLGEGLMDDFYVSDLAALETYRQRRIVQQKHDNRCTCRACQVRNRKRGR
jgi:hypothetical protein